MGKIYKQKCWNCSKACDETQCVWVKTLSEYPLGAIVDDNGFIVSCPNFQEDEIIIKKNKNKYLTIDDLAKKYNISVRTYSRISSRLKSIFGKANKNDMLVFLRSHYGGPHDNEQ